MTGDETGARTDRYALHNHTASRLLNLPDLFKNLTTYLLASSNLSFLPPSTLEDVARQTNAGRRLGHPLTGHGKVFIDLDGFCDARERRRRVPRIKP